MNTALLAQNQEGGAVCHSLGAAQTAIEDDQEQEANKAECSHGGLPSL